MQRRDCTIIGAGPVGLYLARQLKDFDVRIIEEHKEVGKPVQCTGLISTNVDKVHKVPLDCVLNKVKGARIHSPSGKKLEIRAETEQAYVIDRGLFDKSLAEGLEVEHGKRANHLKFNSKYIIGADGPNSAVAQLAGFGEIAEKAPAVQYEIPIGNCDTEFVEMYFGNNIAPGFFAWIVPTDSRLRVGLAARDNIKYYLDKFLNSKIPGARILDTQAGVVPLAPRQNFVKGNVALVGDAAGQVKSTTGGGVYTGMVSAKCLADAIKQGDLQKYQNLWKKELGRDFSFNNRIRRAIGSISDVEMEKVWDILIRDDVKKMITKYGGMDHPTKLVKGLLRNPKLLRYVPYFMRLCKQ